MTAVEGSAQTSAPAPDTASPAPELAPAPAAPPPAAPAASSPPAERRQTLRAVGTSLTLLGIFLLGFVAYLYGLSSVQESRSQAVLYTELRTRLGAGIAPLGPTAPCSATSSKTCPTTPGTAEAILSIPAIGVRDLVVVAGTSPESLMLGPGVLRNGPMPGQAGLVQIYGRRATFGAPFARIGELRPGDIIKATTGQGISKYRVAALGSSSRLVRDGNPNRLVLLTAQSAAVPAYYTYVDADLVTSPQPVPGGLPAIFTDETALSGDGGALVLTVLWALALAGVSAIATIAALRWKPWPTYLAAAPVVLVVLWNLYQSLAALLPNVY